MEDLFEIVFALGIIVGISLLVAQMSKEREIGFWTLFTLSLLLTPFVALIVGLFSKRKRKEGELPISNDEAKDSQNGLLSRFMGKKEKPADNKQELDMPNFDKGN